MLLYLFGSKEGLLTEVFGVCRQRQLDLLNGALDATDDPDEAMWRLWRSWLADPGRAGLMRLFFEIYLHSLQGACPYGDFASASVYQWLDILGPMNDEEPDDRVRSTLTLAVLRGLLLDALATNDTERVERALRHYLDQSRGSGAPGQPAE